MLKHVKTNYDQIYRDRMSVVDQLLTHGMMGIEFRMLKPCQVTSQEP